MSLLLILYFCTACLASSTIPGGDVIRQTFAVTSNFSYHFNILIGTPPQMVTTYLDFATADLYMISGTNPCINASCSPYTTYETYQQNASSTFASKNSYFTSALSSDGSLVSGIWAEDVVQIAGVTLNNTRFVYHGETTSSEGTTNTYGTSSYVPGTFFASYFGLGPKGLQQTVQWVEDGTLAPTYDSILYRIPNNAPSYSIWVDPATDSTGVITFGAIDSGQYIPGSLVTVPILSLYSSYETINDLIYIGVAVFSLDLNFIVNGNEWINQTLFYCSDVAILNSRANFSVPATYLQQIGTALSATWAGSQGYYLVPCSTSGTIVLYISGYEFIIPLEEQLINTGISDINGAPMCGLNIGVSDTIYLSNKVLKNYFIAVDYTLNQLSFGKRAYVGQVPTPATRVLNDTVPEATKAGLYSYTSLDSDNDVSLVLTYTGTQHTYNTDISSNYILGGTPVPTVAPKVFSNQTRSLPKATEASNVSPKLESWAIGLISLVMWFV